jgi:hypothetical protein
VIRHGDLLHGSAPYDVSTHAPSATECARAHSRPPGRDGNVANAAKAGKRFFAGVTAIATIGVKAGEGGNASVPGNDGVAANARNGGLAGNARKAARPPYPDSSGELKFAVVPLAAVRYARF